MNAEKYTRQFFPIKNPTRKWTQKNFIEKAPSWCSVDLRDGNQSLIIPMSIEEKLEFFKLLVNVGFKEIEVGFPAASETEYMFLRKLIEEDLIPDDVTIQVLTQSREHIIKKTFEALKGVKNAIVHLYNSTSLAQREQVFCKTKDEIIKIATDGAYLLDKISSEIGVNYTYEYSPESFTGTEPEFALEICNAVLDIWKPSKNKKVIINLPVTVELSMPHVYADQVEYMCDNLKYREFIEVSLHPHNDRGCAVADCELGLLAGADRIEGTLFGNGERTGNADIITVALNMYSQGIDPKLDFSNITDISKTYEKVTRMQVYDRQPYAGKLVFAAFSGSHQDAIAKGMKWRENNKQELWTVPYLPIDPCDLGRIYEADVIRINSQSGKGGIGYLLEHNFGYIIPRAMREDVGYTIKNISDRSHAELSVKEVHDAFINNYVNINTPISLVSCKFEDNVNTIAYMKINTDSECGIDIMGVGNGKLDAVINGIKQYFNIDINSMTYEEHALNETSSSEAITYLSFSYNKKTYFGAGIDTDIMTSSIKAFFSTLNRAYKNIKTK